MPPRVVALGRNLARSWISFLVSLMVPGCGFFEYSEEVFPDTSPQVFYIAIDNSTSYGLPPEGDRIQPSPRVFDAAKDFLRSDLTGTILKHGDLIIAITAFTDESVLALVGANALTGGPILVDSSAVLELDGQLSDVFSGIKGRTDTDTYTTYYRNVLDVALREFDQNEISENQRLVLVLTDERGSEAAPGTDLPLADYRQYPLVKLTAEARGGGRLLVTPNAVLAEIAGTDEPLNTADLVGHLRDRWRLSNPIEVTRIHGTRLGILIVTALFAVGTILYQARRHGAIDTTPRIDAHYNPSAGTIVVAAPFSELPTDPLDYILHDGQYRVSAVELGESDGRAYLTPDPPLEAGPVKLVVHTRSAGELRTTLSVAEPPRESRYAVSVSRLSSESHQLTQVLDRTEVNLLDGLSDAGKLLAHREGKELVIRLEGPIQHADGTTPVHPDRYQLSQALSHPIMYFIEDGRDGVRILVTEE